MKRLFFFLGILLLSSGVSAGNLSALFSYCTFDLPDSRPYIETYLNITGTSTKLVLNPQGKLQSKVEVQIVIKSGEKIVHFDKFNMLSPELDKGDSIVPDFIDQQRVALNNGKYMIEMTIADKNSDAKSLTLNQEIEVFFPTTKVSISDIEYLEAYSPATKENKFSKSGYDLVPYVNTFYPKEFTSLKFYTEVYRSSDFTTDILIRYFVSNSDNNKLIDNLFGTLKQKAAPVNVVLAELPISGLPSGNYHLNLEIRDRENKVLTYRQTFFQRSNQQTKVSPSADISNIDITNSFVTLYTNLDTLKEYLHYLYPISSRIEEEVAESQAALGDLRSMQQYLFYFWSKRDPEHPDVAWNNYLAEVEKVNASFPTRNKRGYETDRGRVYLQYGEPNTITNNTDDPAAYPYEVWHFYKIRTTNQTNRKFVFYTMDRSSNDFRLLHSDARGELQDNAWELKLHSRSQKFGADIDKENSEDIYGSRTKENFTNPR